MSKLPRSWVVTSVVALIAMAGCSSHHVGMASTATGSSSAGATSTSSNTTSSNSTSGAGGSMSHAPIAVVYRDDAGAAGCDGCALAVGTLLQGSKWGFDVRYVGPHEPTQLTATTLAGAALYAQPGGGGSVAAGFAEMQGYAPIITSFVENGGRYLGFCMGGYLAGFDPGFNLLPGDSGEFVGSPGANVQTAADTVIAVTWRGQQHHLYFQDGPYFVLKPGAVGVNILATYPSNGEIAALVASYGMGKVGVVGPHPEATADWYAAYNLSNPDGINPAVGLDFVDAVMQ